MEYLVFEGVRDMRGVLEILLKTTDLEIICAPYLIAVELGGSSPEPFFADPGLAALEDTPEGFWIMDVRDRDYLSDRVEEAYRRAGKRAKGKSVR